MGLVECVPNFSCIGALGERLGAVVARSPGVRLLGCEGDPDHGRTVLTFAGEADDVEVTARRLLDFASAHIDLRAHSGVHPRFGATDVLPFVPLEGSTMADCVQLAEALGDYAARELGIPTFLYGEAARAPTRVDLAALRRELAAGGAPPDLAPRGEANPGAGVLVTGARSFLIAYNVNLACDDLELARRIARRIRASNGGLPALKALGFRLASRGQVQVSMNLCDYRQTGIAEAFAAVAEACHDLGVEVADGELVGLVPRGAAIAVAGRATGLGDGLRGRIVEEQMSKELDDATPLADFRRYLREIAAREPAPGGGSAAALALGLASATLEKALSFSAGSATGERGCWPPCATALEDAGARRVALAEADRASFSKLMDAYKMKVAEHGKAARRTALSTARAEALACSDAMLEEAFGLIELGVALLERGNENLVNDIALGLELACAAARGAAWNGLANCAKRDVERRATLRAHLARVAQASERTLAHMAARYGG